MMMEVSGGKVGRARDAFPPMKESTLGYLLLQ